MRSRERGALCSSFSLPDLIDTLIWSRAQQKIHPDRLCVDGLICFCGSQGSGKSLAAVQYLLSLAKQFPSALICTNIDVFPLSDRIIPYQGVEQLIDLDNGELGVIFLIDEIHLEFNSLESKKMDASIFELVSQQRKARKHIIGTSQVFGRLAKPFREQFKFAVLCEQVIGHIYLQRVYRSVNVSTDDDIKPVLEQFALVPFIANPAMYESYDTTQLIKRQRGDF